MKLLHLSDAICGTKVTQIHNVSVSAHCSFCHKSAARAGRLLVPAKDPERVAICEECIDVCRNILADDAKFPEPVPMPPEPADERNIQCSFCLKFQDAVQKLISSPKPGPHVYICDGCVNSFSQKLQELKSHDFRQVFHGWVWQMDQATSETSASRGLNH